MGVTKNHIHTEDQIALARLFKALGHPARIAIIEKLLTLGDINCKELGKHIQLAQSTISEHMRQLHDVGILGVSAVANNALYAVAKPALEQVTSYIDQIFEVLKTFVPGPFSYARPLAAISSRNFRASP